MNTISSPIAVIAALAVAAGGPVWAAEKKGGHDLGKSEYMNSCAVCHGVNGKVEGPEVAAIEFLKTKPTDLSTLSRRNGGVFPFDRVYAIIDGRQMVSGHGTRDMPIWGQRYSQEKAKAEEYYFDMPYDMEMYARSRILAIIDYINRIQVK